MTIGFHDAMIPEAQKQGAIIWMNKIIDSIIEQAQIWIYEKCQKHDFDFEELNNIK
ncbi:hypothetical protein LB456_03415 [Psychroflexus sp. CAK57W]|uniref:hypothetical protein n=1 Tax=Psychroflexus curvus TaxID=2873595 RepID=UPI001CC9D92E|nr:hypothetical protein [Psychroflexus curvus]MBZ9626722.1 hypothetical protein [Psychroflexus curvus]MBZ9786497.1 hypothetical protein [Psychroflexus curvus]